jgi:hypothetical protein
MVVHAVVCKLLTVIPVLMVLLIVPLRGGMELFTLRQ